MAKEKQITIPIAADGSDMQATLVNLDAQLQKVFGMDLRALVTLANRTIDDHGRHVDGMTGLYREHRGEIRMQRFVLREYSEALGALSLGLSAFGLTAEGEFKKFADAGKEGLLAFQGTSFALASLGLAGPIGAAIAGVTALSAAFVTFNQSADKAAEEGIKKFLDEVKKVGLFDWETVKSDAEKKLKEIQDRQAQLKPPSIVTVTPAGPVESAGMMSSAAKEEFAANETRIENIKKIITQTQAEIDNQKMLNEIMQAGNSVLGNRTSNILQQIDKQIADQQKILENVLSTEYEIRSASAAINDLEAKKNDLLGKGKAAIIEHSNVQKLLAADTLAYGEALNKKFKDEFELIQKIEAFRRQPLTIQHDIVTQQLNLWTQNQLENSDALKPRKVEQFTKEERQLLTDDEKLWNEWSQGISNAGSVAFQSVNSGIDDMVKGMIEGTETMAQAFEKMSLQIIEQIAAMIIKMAIFEAFSGGSVPAPGPAISGSGGVTFPTGNITGTKPGSFGEQQAASQSRFSPISINPSGQIVQNHFNISTFDPNGMAKLAASTEFQKIVAKATQSAFKKGITN